MQNCEGQYLGLKSENRKTKQISNEAKLFVRSVDQSQEILY